MTTTEFIIDAITVLGTAAFALAAVLAALEKRVDIFSVTVLGVITAVGGGTIRDCILDVPVFWSEDISYITIACVASLLGFFFFRFIQLRKINTLYLYIDALAIAMFAIQGTDKAWALGFGLPVAPVILGIITAVGGGVVRDTLLQRPSLLLTKELYAIPVALGCLLYTGFLMFFEQYTQFGALISAGLVVYLRHLSIQKHIVVPSWAIINYRA
ncbi:TRIC cation channel family protein [Vibrio sp. D404a]|uniref:trimeric intracellular cation channel family protein n=1 Tax=unclassified Vibrio TaxID=2614977 RepID=UPI0025532BF7|nr:MULTISPECIES: TRIC cation channel family protein [unclassified Vibrio]MDK9736431.1 TRIC cation channel family protein [Vibrio sp. D404a]MDK9796053.1 TRIC cation channel family protein [Vibrio sp. D449a]